MSKYLKPDHPSFGCDQAWFLFAVRNHGGPGFCRLVLVEATNHAAVSFLERVSDGGSVSSTVVLMTVHRQSVNVGIRSDMAEEVAFRDFANDMVDRALVDRDSLAVQAYQEATAKRAFPAAPRVPASAVGPVGGAREDVVSALSGLGFRRPQAEAMVDALGPLGGRETSELIREALKSAKSAAS